MILDKRPDHTTPRMALMYKQKHKYTGRGAPANAGHRESSGLGEGRWPAGSLSVLTHESGRPRVLSPKGSSQSMSKGVSPVNSRN